MPEFLHWALDHHDSASDDAIVILPLMIESFGRRMFSMRKPLMRRTTQNQPRIADTRNEKAAHG
jgi:hypothetical protein